MSILIHSCQVFVHRQRAIVSMFGLWALLALGVALVSAQSNTLYDGRINITEPLGGSAIYCVDQFNQPSDWYATGGIRVLNSSGQEQLFVTDDVINGVDIPLVPTLLGTGTNDYGTISLTRLPDRNFVLAGTDEHGKAFEFVWQGCRRAPEQASPLSTPVPQITLEVTPTEESTIEMTPTEESTIEMTPTEESTIEMTPTEEGTPEMTPTEEGTPEMTPTEEGTPEMTPTEEGTPEMTPTDELPYDPCFDNPMACD